MNQVQELIDTYARIADTGYQLISHIEMSMVRHGGSFGDNRILLANQIEIWALNVETVAKLAVAYPHASWAGIVAQFVSLYTWGTAVLKAVKS